MKYAPWIAGVAVLVVALAAIAGVLMPQSPLRTTRPAEAWGDLSRGLGRETAPSPAARPKATPGSAIFIVEQVSPIVSADSTLNESLGIESPRGRFRAVLPRGTPVKYARSVTFGTAVDDQQEIRLHVLRGRSETAAENHSLGWVRVADLPKGAKGATRVAITFQVVDGAIVLVAENAGTGGRLSIQESEAPPGYNNP